MEGIGTNVLIKIQSLYSKMQSGHLWQGMVADCGRQEIYSTIVSI